jgi:hypothetical protein
MSVASYFSPSPSSSEANDTVHLLSPTSLESPALPQVVHLLSSSPYLARGPSAASCQAAAGDVAAAMEKDRGAVGNTTPLKPRLAAAKAAEQAKNLRE